MRRPSRTSIRIALAAPALLLASCGTDSPAPTTPSDAPVLVVHRSPTCSCCGGWQAEMRAAGMHVTERHHDDMAKVKEEYDIPADQRSCHTTEVAGYFVEGHVPLEAIEDLLTSQPDVDGIALAGMPPGAPGMPGPRTGPLVVTTIVDGEVVGELGRY